LNEVEIVHNVNRRKMPQRKEEGRGTGAQKPLLSLSAAREGGKKGKASNRPSEIPVFYLSDYEKGRGEKKRTGERKS